MGLTALLALLMLGASPATPAGDWRGTSLCQVHPSACNDEQAVYHISAIGSGFHMQMNKIVGGEEQEMGAIDAKFDASSATLTGTTHDRQGRPGLWRFVLAGDRLAGTLTVGGTVYRRIEVTRAR
jgi:hypothetical protein